MSLEDILKELNEDLIVNDIEKIDGCIYVTCEMPVSNQKCPYCGERSSSVHSTYIRKINDLPIQGISVKLLLKTHKYFCNNKKCDSKTFSENFNFIEPSAVRTKRLDTYINKIGLRDNSMDAVKTLKDSGIAVSSNTVLRIIKKNKNS